MADGTANCTERLAGGPCGGYISRLSYEHVSRSRTWGCMVSACSTTGSTRGRSRVVPVALPPPADARGCHSLSSGCAFSRVLISALACWLPFGVVVGRGADTGGGEAVEAGAAQGSATADVGKGIPFGVGDLVRIGMAEDPDVHYDGVISASGSIPIPYLGEFSIAGLHAGAAESALSAALCEELYHRATVTATLVRRAPGKVYVYGAVKRPGDGPGRAGAGPAARNGGPPRA